jgi:4'-phosphopantetheinyl transferase
VVSQYELVGVDVEHVKAGNSLWDVAQTAFSPREIESLRHLPDEALSRRFFDYWTLKEAYLKARGCGLNLPPDQFSIMIASERIMIEFGPGVGDDPLRWHFAIGSPSAAHRLAIADGTGTPGGLPIVDRIGTLPGNRLNLPCGGLPSGSRAAG